MRKERRKKLCKCEKTKRKAIKKSTNPKQDLPIFGTSQGIRTPVTAVRGRCPRPLDQGGIWLRNKDSNLNNTSQSRRCYRYTIPLYRANTCRVNENNYSRTTHLCQPFFRIPRKNFSRSFSKKEKSQSAARPILTPAMKAGWRPAHAVCRPLTVSPKEGWRDMRIMRRGLHLMSVGSKSGRYEHPRNSSMKYYSNVKRRLSSA